MSARLVIEFDYIDAVTGEPNHFHAVQRGLHLGDVIEVCDEQLMKIRITLLDDADPSAG